MFGVPIMISLFVGILLAEIVFRVLCMKLPHIWMSEIMSFSQTFRQAAGDDARQAVLLRIGRAAFSFGLLGLALFLGLAVLAWLPPWALRWSEPQQLAYVATLSVVVTLWCLMRPSLFAANRAK